MTKKGGPMIRWQVEFEGRKIGLGLLTAPSMRDVIDPVFRHLETRLVSLSREETILEVVFVVDNDASLSVEFRGDLIMVNRARDIIGTEDVVGPLRH